MYHPGETIVHRLDPRTKLLGQLGIAGAAFAYPTTTGLAVLTVLTLFVLFGARMHPLSTLWSYRFVFPFLLLAPLIGALTIGSPWIRLSDGIIPLRSSYRVLLVLLVGAVYVRTTSVRESQAAIAWIVPGKPGRVLGLSVGLVFRFLPVLRQDLLAIRAAMHARLGTERPVHHRMQLLTTTGLTRAFGRADRLSLALQARCLSWEPTMPALRFGRLDLLPLLLGIALLFVTFIPLFSGY